MPSNSPRATTDPWAGMRSVTQGGQMPAFSAPTHAAPASGQGGSNPFSSALFASDSGGLPGLIGMLTGAPTRQEMAQNKASEGQRQGFVALQNRIASGMSPQAAVVDFMQSPEGQQFFTSSQDPIGALKGYLQTTIAKPVDPIITSPGQEVLNGSDPSQVLHQTPTTEIQNTTGLMDIANLGQEDRASIAKAMLEKQAAITAGNPTQAESAFKHLVDKGIVTQDTADKMMAGVITTVPLLNSAGETTGHALLDMSDPANPKTIEFNSKTPGLPAEPGTPDYAPGVTPGTLPADVQDTQGALLNPDNPGDIILGAGFVPAITEFGGGMLGQMVPPLAAKETTRQRNALRAIIVDAQNLRGAGAGGGRGLKDDVKMLSGLIDRMGVMNNPIEQGQALVDYHGFLTRRAEADAQAVADPATSNKVRGAALEDLAAIRSARASLPAVADLQKTMKEYEASAGQLVPAVQDLKGAASKVENGAAAVGNEVLGNPPAPVQAAPVATFKTEQDAAKAFQSGKIKAGDRISIGGQTGTVGGGPD